MGTHSNWRYTCNIPLWILGKDTDGESVAVSLPWAMLLCATTSGCDQRPVCGCETAAA